MCFFAHAGEEFRQNFRSRGLKTLEILQVWHYMDTPPPSPYKKLMRGFSLIPRCLRWNLGAAVAAGGSLTMVGTKFEGRTLNVDLPNKQKITVKKIGFPEGPARQLDVSRQKLTPHCLETIFDSQLPSPKLSPQVPHKFSTPQERAFSLLSKLPPW